MSSQIQCSKCKTDLNDYVMDGESIDGLQKCCQETVKEERARRRRWRLGNRTPRNTAPDDCDSPDF